MFNRTVTIGLLVATGVAGSLGARAADMPGLFPTSTYSDAEPPPQMEWGTGWYLRGDVAATDGIVPAILVAVPPKKRDWNYAVGGGAGYKFNDYFRADITGEYREPQKQSVTYDAFGDRAKATVERWDALANGYVDLGNWSGFTPYVGAGVGVAGFSTFGTFTAFDGTQIKLGGADRYHFAWAAMGGVAYQIASHLALDVGYRYLDLGSYRAPQGTAVQKAIYSAAKSDLNAHEVRIGLRYQID